MKQTSTNEYQTTSASEKLVESIKQGIQEKKGSQIVVAELGAIEGTICKNFIICQGNSPTQVEAITESIAEMAEVYKTVGGTPHLDGQYTVFGEVVEGLEVVDRIEQVATDKNDRPQVDIRILRAVITKNPFEKKPEIKKKTTKMRSKAKK